MPLQIQNPSLFNLSTWEFACVSMSNHHYNRNYSNFIRYEYTTYVKCGSLVCPVQHSGCKSEQSVSLLRKGTDIDTAYELIQKADQTEPVKLFCCFSTVNTPEQRGELYSRAGDIFVANSKCIFIILNLLRCSERGS